MVVPIATPTRHCNSSPRAADLTAECKAILCREEDLGVFVD